MRKIASLIAGLALMGTIAGSLTSVPVAAQQTSRDDQERARQEMKAGNALTVREIERRVLPRMQGYEYLTFEYDGVAGAYRLKFIRNGRVTYVDVDARTGRIINRSN